MKVSLILCTVFIIICGLYSTDATICKPDSTFKIDCNLCHCSQNGKSYSCTDHLCPPPDNIDFSEEELPNGYILLKPKVQSDAGRMDDEDGFVLTRKQRNEGIPYINDAIPSSIEENTVLDWDRPRESEDGVGKGEMEVDKSWESAAYDFVKNAMLEE